MGRPTAPREHGTRRGYDQHRYFGEPQCDPCRTAMKERSAERRAAGLDTKGALRTKARGRAMQRLAERHPAEFLDLLNAEIARIGEEQSGS